MNELIAKLEKEVSDFTARQEVCLKAADAEGCSDEDRAKHLAEFDQLEISKSKSKACLSRASKAAQDRAEIDANRRDPAVAAIVQAPATGPNNAGRLATLPASVRRTGPLKAFRGQDAELRAYRTGLWVAATQYNHRPSADRLQEHGIQATLSTTNNSGAAYFVPEVMATTVIELQELYGVIRRLADVEPMSSETWSGPRWSNSMTAYWVSQGVAPTQSEPGWDRIELAAKDLAAFGKQTAQLNEDAIINLGDKWAMAAAVAFSYAEDNAAFNGTGASAYGGITGLLTKVVAAANAASLYTATGHTTLPALTMGDFNAVVGKFPNYPGAKPCWLCHKEVWANSMANLQMAAGGLTAMDVQEGAKPKFLGYDVEWVNVMPKASTVTSGVTGILFADLALAVKFGDRRQRTLRSAEINDDMIKQLITLFAASRVDINVHTIVDPKDSTAAGPVVGLKLG